MKLKLFLLSILVLVFFSFQMNKHQANEMDYLIVYDNYNDNGTISRWIFPNILILKKNIEHPENNSYESYFKEWSSVLGKWEIKEDTLYLYPQYLFRHDSIITMEKLDPNNLESFDENLINQKWLITGDKIYDRSDYSMCSVYDENGNMVLEGNTLANRERNLRLRSKTKLN